MAERLSERDDGWTYRTSDDNASGFEAEPVAVSDSRCLIHSIQIETQLAALPTPFWIHLFDRSDDDNMPQGGEAADVPGPPVFFSGALIIFDPVKEKQDWVAFAKMLAGCMKDPSWKPEDSQGIFEGFPFNRGVVVVVSSTPGIYTPIVGSQINVVARGRNR